MSAHSPSPLSLRAERPCCGLRSLPSRTCCSSTCASKRSAASAGFFPKNPVFTSDCSARRTCGVVLIVIVTLSSSFRGFAITLPFFWQNYWARTCSCQPRGQVKYSTGQKSCRREEGEGNEGEKGAEAKEAEAIGRRAVAAISAQRVLFCRRRRARRPGRAGIVLRSTGTPGRQPAFGE